MSVVTPIKRMIGRLRAFVSSRDLDAELDEELAAHISMLTDDNIRRGMPRDAARAAALLRVGSLTSLKQQHRDVRGLPALDALMQDVRFALRLAGRDRWFSAAAIVALSLGIAANATGFMIVNAAFFRGLPFEDARQLYMLSWQTARPDRTADLSYPELQEWRAQTTSFELAAFSEATLSISDEHAYPEQAAGAWVTANAFDVLRQPPRLGRGFVPDDERPGSDRVVILGHDVWTSRYDADPGVVGRIVRVNAQPATIIGVMPDGMKFPDNAEIWAPFIPGEAEFRRDARLLTAFARLRSDVDRRSAYAELDGAARQLMAAYPEPTKNFVGASMETFNEAFVGNTAQLMFLIIMAAMGLVLVIACANVANLLLSRSATRAREIALRMAMGATRWRVIRQLLVESLVLGAAGGVIGLVLASLGVDLFEAAMQDAGKPYWLVFRPDAVVFAYVAAVCVLTAVICGITPALHITKANSHDVLKEGGRGTTAHRRVRWFSSAMIAVEVALTIVLLVAAGLLGQSFMKLYVVDLGIDTGSLMTMKLRLPETTYATPDERRRFIDRLHPRLRSIPGVEAAAITNGVPPFDGGERLLQIDSAAGARIASPRFVSTVTTTPDFFDAVGRPLVRGRFFRETDGLPGAEAVIVNERLAAQFFPGQDPIGRRLRFTEHDPAPGAPADVWRTIVGISAPIGYGSSDERYVNAVVYIPYRQEAPRSVALLIRSRLTPATVMAAVRREVQAIDADQPVMAIETLERGLAADRWSHRVFGSLFVILGLIAITLSGLGLYAMMSYAVAQRTQEIGVRVAIGAQRHQLTWMILRRGLAQVAMGLPLGFAGAVILGAGLRRMLVDMTPVDPLTFAAVTIIVFLVSVAACLVPARRAMRVDAVVALRAD